MTNPNRSSQVGEAAPWPKGKPRNPPSRQWISLRSRIRKMIDGNPDRSVPPEQRRSARAVSQRISDAIGVNPRTVQRWISGEKNPSPEYVAAIAEWLPQS